MSSTRLTPDIDSKKVSRAKRKKIISHDFLYFYIFIFENSSIQNTSSYSKREYKN